MRLPKEENTKDLKMYLQDWLCGAVEEDFVYDLMEEPKEDFDFDDENENEILVC